MSAGVFQEYHTIGQIVRGQIPRSSMTSACCLRYLPGRRWSPRRGQVSWQARRMRLCVRAAHRESDLWLESCTASCLSYLASWRRLLPALARRFLVLSSACPRLDGRRVWRRTKSRCTHSILTLSGIGIFYIGSAFWGLFFGVAVSWLMERTALRKAWALKNQRRREHGEVGAQCDATSCARAIQGSDRLNCQLQFLSGPDGSRMRT